MRLSLLFLSVLIVSCNNTALVNPHFEPYKIGTWLITSPETAIWKGVADKKKSNYYSMGMIDVQFISTPENHSLSIATNDDESSFSIRFTDKYLEISEYTGIKSPFVTPYKQTGFSIKGDEIFLDFEYNCEEPQRSSDEFILEHWEYVDESKPTFIKAYSFSSEGFGETVRHLVGCRQD